MTPKQVTTIDLNELKEIELKCECGASVRLPLPIKSGNLIAAQDCPGCTRRMWEGTTHPNRLRVQNLLRSIAEWKDAANPVLSLRFIITEEA
jgi:hypothetical protein